jgi:hypothetical protein
MTNHMKEMCLVGSRGGFWNYVVCYTGLLNDGVVPDIASWACDSAGA